MNKPISIDDEMATVAFCKAQGVAKALHGEVAQWRVYERVANLLSNGIDPQACPICDDEHVGTWNEGQTALRCCRCGLNLT